MSFQPQYAFQQEIKEKFHSRFKEILKTSLAENFSGLDQEVILSVAEQITNVFLVEFTPIIQTLINQKVDNIKSRKVGW
jgi:hypothetical protein